MRTSSFGLINFLILSSIIGLPNVASQWYPDWSINPEPPGQAVIDGRQGYQSWDLVNLNFNNPWPFPHDFEVVTTCSGLNVNPSTIIINLGPLEPGSVSINISASPGQSLTKKTCLVRVTSLGPSGTSNFSTYMSRITAFEAAILQYAEIEFSALLSSVTGEKDKVIPMMLSVTNRGNYNDDYQLSVEGLPEGWKLTGLPEQLLGVDQDETIYLNLKVIPDSAERVLLTFTAISLIEGPRGDSQSVSVEVKAENPPISTNSFAPWMTNGLILLICFLILLWDREQEKATIQVLKRDQ